MKEVKVCPNCGSKILTKRESRIFNEGIPDNKQKEYHEKDTYYYYVCYSTFCVGKEGNEFIKFDNGDIYFFGGKWNSIKPVKVAFIFR